VVDETVSFHPYNDYPARRHSVWRSGLRYICRLGPSPEAGCAGTRRSVRPCFVQTEMWHIQVRRRSRRPSLRASSSGRGWSAAISSSEGAAAKAAFQYSACDCRNPTQQRPDASNLPHSPIMLTGQRSRVRTPPLSEGLATRPTLKFVSPHAEVS
jgi:hypothetical protein